MEQDKTEKLIRKLCGKPRAAVVSVWTAQDGFCLAGIVLIDRRNAVEQNLLARHLPEEVSRDQVTWSPFKGFANGEIARGETPYMALVNLELRLRHFYVKIPNL